MATRSGKAYSERPASAETYTPNSNTDSPQEPGLEETSMDLGDEIKLATSPVGDKDQSDLEGSEGAALDASHTTEICSLPLEVEVRPSVDDLVAEDGCRSRSADGADLTDCRPRSADSAEADDDYVNTESSQDIFLPAQRTTDHSPGLPTTPPDRISTQRAPMPETPECAGRASPAWSDYDGSKDPYGEIPDSWTIPPPVHARYSGQYGL
ncbi:hypothetical protein JB92DRAFT_3133936 [Gautieria morchelliformis]|nr:hypothetical protein JB92DRAFT_3133936 [Gautieria morchelliformis]